MRVYLNLKVTQNGLFSHFLSILSPFNPQLFPLNFLLTNHDCYPDKFLHIRNPLYLEYSRLSEILQNDTFVKSILIKKKKHLTDLLCSNMKQNIFLLLAQKGV